MANELKISRKAIDKKYHDRNIAKKKLLCRISTWFMLSWVVTWVAAEIYLIITFSETEEVTPLKYCKHRWLYLSWRFILQARVEVWIMLLSPTSIRAIIMDHTTTSLQRVEVWIMLLSPTSIYTIIMDHTTSLPRRTATLARAHDPPATATYPPLDS
jgi:hypothetical protein